MRYEHPFGPPEEDEPAFDWLVIGGAFLYVAVYGGLAFAVIWGLRWFIGWAVGIYLA